MWPWRARRERRERELDSEIQAHLDLEAAELLDAGAEDPRMAAQRAFGNVAVVREKVRDEWGWTPIEQFAQDIRYAFRTMWRSPGLTAAAVVSLAFGIGTDAAIFSFADAIVLRPLAISDPGSLLVLRSTSPETPTAGISYPDFKDFRDRSTSFQGLIAHRLSILPFAKDFNAVPQMRMGMRVTSDFFQELGVEPVLGRGFVREETDVPGRDAVVVLGYGFWQSEFGGDPHVIGRTVRIGQVPVTIVGVAPPQFTGMDPIIQPYMYVPAMLGEQLGERTAEGRPASFLEQRDELGFIVRGRLRPGVTRAHAQAEISSIARKLEAEFPETNRRRGAVLRTDAEWRNDEQAGLAGMMLLLLGLSALVLIIVCVNIANLFLSRARGRSREIAVRLAIGAGQFRLVRQLLTESLMVACMGGAAGLGLAYGGIRYLRSIRLPTDTPIVIAAQMDTRVLAFGATAAALSALVFGLVPALQAGRTDLVAALKQAGLGLQRRRRMIGRQTLVVGQVAMCLVLLVATGMMLEAFRRMVVLDPGFRTERILMMEFDPGAIGYSKEQVHDFYRQLAERAGALPGVTSATLTRAVPLRPSFSDEIIVPEGYDLPAGQEGVRVTTNSVDEEYFETMGTPILSGRAFTPDDRAGARQTAIVNDTFAATFWPGRDPVGRRLRLGRSGPWLQVVGVVPTAKYIRITERPTPYVFLPLDQHRVSRLTLLVHTAGDPLSVAEPIRHVVRSLDRRLPIANMRSLRSFYEDGPLGVQRLILQLVTSMGALGLCLAIVGVYAVVTYSVRRRMREFGVRMSIGASRGDILRLVMREGLVLAGAGVLLGLALSVPVERALGAAMAGVGPLSPWTLVVVPFGLTAVILGACLGPAWHASRVDPTMVLRLE